MKKNILLIHCDQLRADCLGFAGNSFVRTPNIDALAEDATVLTRHIASNSICMPSRASLLTGLYPTGHGVWHNGVALNRREYVPPIPPPPDFIGWKDMPTSVLPEVPTMADMFTAQGYDTVSLGKLHLTPNLADADYGFPESWPLWKTGNLDDWSGPYYGFRHTELTCSHGEEVAFLGHYGRWLEREHPDIAAAARQNVLTHECPIPEMPDYYASKIPSHAHNTTWLAERFDAYLDTVDEKPFFAFVGFPDPHHPFTPSPDIFDLFRDADVHEPADPEGAQNAVMPIGGKPQNNIASIPEESKKNLIRATYAMIYQIDQAVGKIITSLKRTGKWDNTIIVFTSDHGDYLCDHGLIRKSLCASDSLLHIPCLIRVPRGMKDGGSWDFPSSNCDILPTLASLAEVTPPEHLHGRDLTKISSDGSEHYAYSFMADAKPELMNCSVYSRDFRFTYYPSMKKGELYNHRQDPAEVENLFDSPSHRKQVAEHQHLLESQLMSTYNPVLSRIAIW